MKLLSPLHVNMETFFVALQIQSMASFAEIFRNRIKTACLDSMYVSFALRVQDNLFFVSISHRT